MAITNASKLADFASGASSTNTSVIQVDYTNQRVGIGTTNPTSKLHVIGDVRVSGVVTATTFVGALTGTATSATNIPNLTGAITSNNTTTSLGSFSSANLATALTDETGSGANVFATSPTLVTPVLGAATATSIVVSSGSTFTNGPVLVGTATSTGTASQPLQVTGGAYVSENVGIGTTNPTSKLHVVGDVLLSSVNSGPISGTRNRIINGSMVIDQRNAGVSTTFIAAAAAQYSVDRWYGYCTGANVTGQRITTVGVQAGGLYTYKFTGAASVTGIGFGHRIESYNSIDLAGSTATLAVDLSNSLLTGVGWTAYYANSTDTFGTLASPNKTSIASGTFTVGATTSRYSASISIPAAATTGIEVIFTVGAQTSGTWTISNVQLESGPVATPFERRSYGQELTLCKRYFQFAGNGCFGAAEGAGAIGFAEKFEVPMRVAPTILYNTFYSTTATWRYLSSDIDNGSIASLANATTSTHGLWSQQGGFSGLTTGAVFTSRNSISTTTLFIALNSEL